MKIDKKILARVEQEMDKYLLAQNSVGFLIKQRPS